MRNATILATALVAMCGVGGCRPEAVPSPPPVAEEERSDPGVPMGREDAALEEEREAARRIAKALRDAPDRGVSLRDLAEDARKRQNERETRKE